MKKILITGGAGFIGSHTADLFLQKDFQVVVFDNMSSGKLANLDWANPHLRMVQNDILNYAALAAEIAKCDAVLHLAALPSVPKSIEDPILSAQVNALGFLHVLQAVRAAQRPIRIVYASSAAVYGNATQPPCHDDVPLLNEVASPYALEKANNERYADLYARLFGIKSLGLRYFNVYGPRQDPRSPYSGVIARFIENYKKNEPIVIFGNGKQSRDFIHVTDVARANELALQSDYCGVLNVATGVPETLTDLVQYIEEAGNKPANVQFAEERVGDINQSFASVKNAAQHLQFNYKVTLREGIRLLMQAK